MRNPQLQEHTIADVTADGDGWIVTLQNGAWLTVLGNDVPRAPVAGDVVLVQLPIVLGFVEA